MENSGNFGVAAGEKPSKIRASRLYADFLNSPVLWSILLPLADLIFLAAADYISTLLRLDSSMSMWNHPTRVVPKLAYFGCILASIAVLGGYRPQEAARRLYVAAEVILAVVIGTIAGAFLIYTVILSSAKFNLESRLVLLLISVFFLPPALLLRDYLIRRRDRQRASRPFLIVGDVEDFREFDHTFARMGSQNPLVFVPLHEMGETLAADLGESGKVTILSAEAIPWDDIRTQYEAVIVPDDAKVLDNEWLELLVQLHFDIMPVYSYSSFYGTMWQHVPLGKLDLSWALQQESSLAERSSYRLIKKAFDLGVSGFLLLSALPLLLVAALLVRLDSPGPIFFSQSRIGKGGRKYEILKFRTMYHERKEEGSLYTGKVDRRVTRIGYWLRRLRIDEFPQLINVFRGEMSLIGPRAEWDRLVDTYEKEIPCYHLRHLVKPGITGWAQLNYPYGASLYDATQKLKYDLYYIKNYSIILDIEICLKTILTMLSLAGR